MKKIRIFTVAAAVAPMLSGVVYAEAPAPVPFDGWYVEDGQIVDILGGVDLIRDDGFLQSQFSVDGQSYIRQVIVDANDPREFGSPINGTPGSLGFSDESIIKVDYSQNISSPQQTDGVMLKSQIRDYFTSADGGGPVIGRPYGTGSATDAAYRFDLIAVINTGWATADNGVEVDIGNTYYIGSGSTGAGNDLTITGQSFNFGFWLNTEFDINNEQTGGALLMTQGVALDKNGLETGIGDSTSFVFEELAGASTTDAGGATGVTGLFSDILGYTPQVTWEGGDRVQAFGIGQSMQLGLGGAGDFGHVQVTNYGTDGVVKEVGFASTGGGQRQADIRKQGGLDSWATNVDFVAAFPRPIELFSNDDDGIVERGENDLNGWTPNIPPVGTAGLSGLLQPHPHGYSEDRPEPGDINDPAVGGNGITGIPGFSAPGAADPDQEAVVEADNTTGGTQDVSAGDTIVDTGVGADGTGATSTVPADESMAPPAGPASGPVVP
ncbi:MAG: hypothetical protein L3J70_04760 [Gammaproteobacteria bacterium]|nr:hypothetical protein [Gammaproteobacteria bacterium]